MKTVNSLCRICINCSFQFQVEDNKIVSYEPDYEHPQTNGYCCPKGIAGIEFQQGVGGNRLFESQKKSSDGSFNSIDGLEAAAEIGKKLKAIVDEHGPRSVALLFGSGGYHNTLGNAFSKSWLSAIGSPNFFSTFTIDQSSHIVTAGRMGAHLAGAPNVEDIDVGLISGANPLVGTAGWPGHAVPALDPGEAYKTARQRGTKFIAVDPRNSEFAQRADIHLQLIPGEDATLYAGMIRIMLENNWYNSEFCERYVTNVNRLKKMVEPYHIDYVAERTGVPAEKLRAAAEMFGNAKRPMAGNGTGTSMAPDSNLADFLIKSLNALCGGFRREGEPVRNPNYVSGVSTQPVDMVFPPSRTWEQGPKCRTQDIGKIAGEFPMALFPDEVLTPGEDKIRAIVVFGTNPVMCMPDPVKTIAALKDLDLLVTLDNTMTEVGELSDYVIATTPQYERYDLNGAGESMYLESYIQYVKPIIEKPDSVMHDWQVFWTFGKEMGVELELKHVVFTVPFEQYPSCGMVPMDNMPGSEDLLRQICEHKDISFDKLKTAERGIRPDFPEVQVIAPPEGTPPEMKDARLDVCPDDIAQDLQSLRNKPKEESRYRLSVRRVPHIMNSQYRDSNYSKAKEPGDLAFMNPADMAEEGLSDGMRIDISTEAGQVVGTVKSDATMRQGVIAMTHSVGAPLDDDPDGLKGAYTGNLIPLDTEDCEPINFMPRMTGFPVSITLRQ